MYTLRSGKAKLCFLNAISSSGLGFQQNNQTQIFARTKFGFNVYNK